MIIRPEGQNIGGRLFHHFCYYFYFIIFKSVLISHFYEKIFLISFFVLILWCIFFNWFNVEFTVYNIEILLNFAKIFEISTIPYWLSWVDPHWFSWRRLWTHSVLTRSTWSESPHQLSSREKIEIWNRGPLEEKNWNNSKAVF
jgi:hypothetical protein